MRPLAAPPPPPGGCFQWPDVAGSAVALNGGLRFREGIVFTMKLTHSRAVVLMVVAALMWSTAGVVTRHLDAARSFEVTFWRALFTVVSLLFILPLMRGRKVFANIRGAGTAFWVSSVCWSVMFTAFMVALTMTGVGNVLITMSLGPLMTALIARIFIGHRIPLRTWLAIVVAGLGIAYMYAPQIASGQLLGTLVALCVPIAGASNWTVTQNAHAHGHDVDLVPAVFVGAVISTSLTLPLALPFQATAHDLGLLAYLGVFQLAIPCVLAVLCAGVLKAPEVSLLALLEVLFGILLVWLGAGEAPGTTVLVGGTLVLGALVANELLGWKQRTGTTSS
jgi:drug/metabolite transporter (DMT)-like permease